MEIVNVSGVLCGEFKCEGDAPKPSHYFTITYKDGATEDHHFTVGKKSKTMDDTLNAASVSRAKIAKNAGLAS